MNFSNQEFAIAFRSLINEGMNYLEGNSSLSALNGYIVRAKECSPSPLFIDLLNDWETMVNKRWNEWGLENEPLSEDAFRKWLKEHLETKPFC